MDCLRNLFRKASDIAFLERELALCEKERDKFRLEAIEYAKQIRYERNKRDKDNDRFHQTITKIAGGNPNIYQEPAIIEDVIPLGPTQQQMDSLQILAQEMADDDVANKIDPLPLEDYVQMMLDKSDEYLPKIATE